jgi:hypothetical protein
MAGGTAPASAETVQPITPSKPIEISVFDEGKLKFDIGCAMRSSKQLGMTGYTDEASNAIMEIVRPFLRPSPQVDIEAGAIACSQWVYGVNHGAPSWDRLTEEHRNEYREQAKACARAWGLTWES